MSTDDVQITLRRLVLLTIARFIPRLRALFMGVELSCSMRYRAPLAIKRTPTVSLKGFALSLKRNMTISRESDVEHRKQQGLRHNIFSCVVVDSRCPR